VSPELPSFDLVVATLGRVTSLEHLLDSLAAQRHRAFRVIVVDQNDDDRLTPVLEGTDLDTLHLRSAPGLSRARNEALEHLAADLVAFPDDDCVYPADLLERVAERFASEPSLDGLSVPTAEASGRADRGWSSSGARLTNANVWNLVASAGMFLRRPLLEQVGAFDERLGLGVKQPWSSGEETDYVIRALALGARIEYEPGLVVEHELAAHQGAGLRERGGREGASVGYLLRKHGYPAGTVARMAVRPVGGIVVSLARRDTAEAGFHAATLRGRVRGYLGASRSKSSE
jgi:glycosyltransferase involved in cell wall biosynthesis